MGKEGISLVGRLVLVSVLAATVAHEISGDDQNSRGNSTPRSGENILQVKTLASIGEQDSKESETQKISIERVLAFMGNSGVENITQAAARLGDLQRQGMLVEAQFDKNQLPYVALAVGGDLQSAHFELVVPINFLAQADLAEADIAAHLYSQLAVYETVRNWHGLERQKLYEQRQELEEAAWRKTQEETFWLLGPQFRSEALKVRFSQFLSNLPVNSPSSK